MKKYIKNIPSILTILMLFILIILVLKDNNQVISDKKITEISKPKIYQSLSQDFNSPASADLDKDNNLYFTSPNFHNETLIKEEKIAKASPATIGKIDNNGKLSTWYTFKVEDMEPTSGKIAPMGIAFGPDGNAYVADMQLWFGGESRILRINVKNGKAIDTTVVAKGFSFPNAIVWKGNDMFISDTFLKMDNGKTISGNYKINFSEFNNKTPLQVVKYETKEKHDSHLFDTFTSNGTLTFGANGLTVDSDGSLYTSIMEDGSVLKTTMDKNNNKIETSLFTTGMLATDGMHWDKITNKIYITDLFANAVYSIDMNGKLELIAENNDTNGSAGELDGPSEVIVRNNQAIIMNFDAVFDDPRMINTKADEIHTLSVIQL